MFISFFLFFFLMVRRPPRSTRSDTLFPYTTLFLSVAASLVRSPSLFVTAFLRIWFSAPLAGPARQAPTRLPANGIEESSRIAAFAAVFPLLGQDRKSTRLNSSH